jgi:anti-anti-sigma regulatory factor
MSSGDLSGTTDRSNGPSVRVDLAGELHSGAVVQLRLMLLEAIVVGRPGELIIDLDRAVSLSTGGLAALVGGNVTALEYGTSYRVIKPRGEVREAMQAVGMLDMLADSDDIGAVVGVAGRGLVDMIEASVDPPTPPGRAACAPRCSLFGLGIPSQCMVAP